MNLQQSPETDGDGVCPVCEGPMGEPVAPEGWCAECEEIAEAE